MKMGGRLATSRGPNPADLDHADLEATLEIEDRRLEMRYLRLETRSWRLEIEGWRMSLKCVLKSIKNMSKPLVNNVVLTGSIVKHNEFLMFFRKKCVRAASLSQFVNAFRRPIFDLFFRGVSSTDFRLIFRRRFVDRFSTDFPRAFRRPIFD